MYDKKDIFISYKAEEFKEANEMRIFLENQGFSCWMAPMSISGGSSYASEIPSAIRNCKIYLLILSEAAQKSKWIPRELDQAINDAKVILPYVIEKCTLNDEFAFYLSNVQRYDAWENKLAAKKKLLNEINEFLKPLEESKSGNDVKLENNNTENIKIVKQENIRVKRKKVKKASVKTDICSKKKLIGLLSILTALSVCLFYLFIGRYITIAGKKYEKDTSTIYLEDSNLTEKDLQIISKLKNLRSINLTDCTLPSNGDNLILQKDLYTLKLINCNISDDFLLDLDFSNMRNLNNVDLSGNKDVTDLGIFANNYSTIKMLGISDTSVKDFSILSNFTELNILLADNLGIDNLSFLSETEKLQSITLNHNNLKNLEGLEKNIRLETIEARNNQIKSLEGLRNATALIKVNLNHNSISDISLFEKSASSLKELYLMDNAVSDLSPLTEAVQLQYFNADYNNIESIEALKKCKLLKGISLIDNQLSDLKGIENATELIHLDVSFNKISDLTDLDGLIIANDNTILLNLSNNQIEELKLPEVKKFRGLLIYGNPISNYDILKEVSINNLVFDYDKDIDYAKWKDYDIGTYYIFGNPLDQQLFLEEIFGKYAIHFIDSLDEVEISMNNKDIKGE